MEYSFWKSFVRVEEEHPWYLARLAILSDWAKEIYPGSQGIELGSGTGLAAHLLEKNSG